MKFIQGPAKRAPILQKAVANKERYRKNTCICEYQVLSNFTLLNFKHYTQ